MSHTTLSDIDVPSLIERPYRAPPLQQRRAEIRALAHYLHDTRHKSTANFIQDNPGVLSWYQEKDIHLHLWQQATQQVRKTA